MENKKNVLMLIGDCNKLFVNQIRKKVKKTISAIATIQSFLTLLDKMV